MTVPSIEHPRLGAPIAVYEYRRASGDVAFVVCRFEPKDFRPAQLRGGHWRWNLDGAPVLPYRLPELEQALADGETVYVVDGEKDADALAAAGACATCCARSQGWTVELAEQLTGARRIRVVADRDGGTGERQAREVVELLVRAGAVASSDVEIVQAATGKDAADHLAAGLSLDDLEPLPAEPAAAAGFVFRPIEEFAAVDEPGAEPLASAAGGGVLIPAAGIVLVYGQGGAGKTTLVLDLCFALAAGDSWLDLVESDRPLRIAIVENEGPRPEFRRKLRAKLAASAARLDGRIVALEEPWAALTLASDTDRRALGLALVEHEADLLVLGPLVSAGEFPNGGTPDEVRRFEEHVGAVRGLVERPVALLLVHHENRAGQVSGAWERFPDTLVHVTPQGNGRTRLFWQKARWASSIHGTSTQLVWAETGETFQVEERQEVTEDGIADQLVAAVRDHPGSSWRALRELRDGDGEKRIRGGNRKVEAVRDRLLATGALVNRAALDGRFELFLADDPSAGGSAARTALEPLAVPPPAPGSDGGWFPVPGYREPGTGTTPARTAPEHIADHAEDDLEWR